MGIAMSAPSTKTDSPQNIFALVTCLGFVAMLPLVAVTEATQVVPAWKAAIDSVGKEELVKQFVMGGIFHYLNNEVMYWVLGMVDAVTLAVGNTVKRVVIIVASMLVFGTTMTPLAALGAGIGIAGTGL